MNNCNLLFIDHMPEMELISFAVKGIGHHASVISVPDLVSQEFYEFEDKFPAKKEGQYE